MTLAAVAPAALVAPWSPAAFAAAAAVTAETAAVNAASAAAADEIIVTGERGGRIEAAAAELATVAGGTALIDNAQVEKSGVFTNADVLAFVPGVYAQAASGSDGIKISIRGSAINRGANFFRSGALFEFDGLPVTGPGGTPYELFEPLGLSNTEILRGANGFDRGSLTLGGVINYVSLNGGDPGVSPLGVRLETGSYGYRKYQVSSGGRYGDLDYYVSVTGARRDGYQVQSRGKNFGVAANVGYRITPTIETRFYVRYRETDNQTPGFLTKAQIAANPRQANPIQLAQNASRVQPGSTWIANKTTFTLPDESRLQLGAVYHDYPIDIRGGVTRAKWGYKDITGSLRYERTDEIFGRPSETTLGVLYTTHPTDGYQDTLIRIVGAAGSPTAGLPVGARIRRANYGGTDGNLFLSNESEPLAGLHVLLGGSLVRIERSNDVSLPVVAGLNAPYDRKSWDYGYRFGARYEVTPDIQLFGNISRSVEPPNDWAILTTPPGFPASVPASGLAARGLDLKDQTATTYEIGTRGKAFFGAWSLSLYRAEVKNELLSVEVIPASGATPAITAESNASPTLHQGVEAGLETGLWKSPEGSAFTLRQTYTYNDFRFRRDRVFGRNELPGIPKHVYQAEIAFDHSSGFYATAGAVVAAKNWLDYANSVSANRYQLWNAAVGFKVPDTSYRIFADFQNIGGKHYGAVVSPVYDLAGSDARNPRLTPGDGFTVIGGVSFAF